MAIRKLVWEKGVALGIREKAEKVDDELVLKYLKDNLENPEQLILKCGRSFWDVTHSPELFEEGEEFTPDDLTAIDYKQLKSVEPPAPAFKEEQAPASEDRMNLLFQKTEKEEEEEEETLVRKTYYLRTKDVEALTILCHETRLEVSAMVREVFWRGLTSIANEIEYGDVYAEAENNLSQKGFVGKKKSFKHIIK